MNMTKNFFDFLNSDLKTLHIENNDRFYDFVKIAYNSRVDLLFVNYNNYHKTTVNDTLEYCGFYDKVEEKLYDINYNLKRDILKLDYYDKTYKSMDSLLYDFNTRVREVVDDYVEENKEEFYDAAKDYESDVIEQDIYQNIIDDENEIKYKCTYSSSDKQNVLLCFDKGEQHIFDVALGFIESYKKNIGQQLIDIDKKNEYLNLIYDDSKHKIHKIKKIVDIMKTGEYVKVHVFINKNGVDFDFKYDASVLRNYWSYSYLSTYNMQTSDRKEFEKLYGTREDLHYDDIYKIEYRGKTIYEDKNFFKELDITNQVDDYVL